MIRLPLEQRRTMWKAGYGGIESAIRYAAVELELFLVCHGTDFEFDADDGQRHYANFLAWADSAMVGIDAAVRAAHDQALADSWRELAKHPLRMLMRDSRNVALKGRNEVVGWEYTGDLGDEGWLLEMRFGPAFGSEWADAPVFGTSDDYLHWILEAAVPLLEKAITLGSAGSDSGEMSYPNADPWTPTDAVDLQRLMA